MKSLASGSRRRIVLLLRFYNLVLCLYAIRYELSIFPQFSPREIIPNVFSFNYYLLNLYPRDANFLNWIKYTWRFGIMLKQMNLLKQKWVKYLTTTTKQHQNFRQKIWFWNKTNAICLLQLWNCKSMASLHSTGDLRLPRTGLRFVKERLGFLFNRIFRIC